MARNALLRNWDGDSYEEIHPITKASNVITESTDNVEEALVKKVDKVPGKGLSTEDYTAAEKAKLAGIAAGANNYAHPATHPPSIIAQDANNRFMTDAERTKLSGIATGAQVNRSIATQAQAEAGTDNATEMTPLRVAQAITALAPINHVDVWLGVTSGSGTAYTTPANEKVTAYAAGQRLSFQSHVISGSNPTLKVGTLTALPVRKPNGNAAKIESGGLYTVIVNIGATAFILQGEGGEYGDAVAGDVLLGKTIGTENGLVTGTGAFKPGMVFRQHLYSPPSSNYYLAVGTNDMTGELMVYDFNSGIFKKKSSFDEYGTTTTYSSLPTFTGSSENAPRYLVGIGDIIVASGDSTNMSNPMNTAFVSTDGGSSWTNPVSTSIYPACYSTNRVIRSGNRFIMSIYSNGDLLLLYSANGTTWTQGSNSPELSNHRMWNVDPSTGYVWAVNNSGQIYVSKDSGSTYTVATGYPTVPTNMRQFRMSVFAGMVALFGSITGSATGNTIHILGRTGNTYSVTPASPAPAIDRGFSFCSGYFVAGEWGLPVLKNPYPQWERLAPSYDVTPVMTATYLGGTMLIKNPNVWDAQDSYIEISTGMG
jgi:hypothetical protein